MIDCYIVCCIRIWNISSTRENSNQKSNPGWQCIWLNTYYCIAWLAIKFVKRIYCHKPIRLVQPSYPTLHHWLYQRNQILSPNIVIKFLCLSSVVCSKFCTHFLCSSLLSCQAVVFTNNIFSITIIIHNLFTWIDVILNTI